MILRQHKRNTSKLRCTNVCTHYLFFQAAKICNNLLLAVSMIGVSEATNLAIRLGLEPEMIAKVINMSSGRCWSSDTYNPCPGIIEGIPSSNNYQGGFASQLMVKVSQQWFLGPGHIWSCKRVVKGDLGQVSLNTACLAYGIVCRKVNVWWQTHH